jgi:hypothetical protein
MCHQTLELHLSRWGGIVNFDSLIGNEPFLYGVPMYILAHRARAALPDTRSHLHFLDEGVIPKPWVVTITSILNEADLIPHHDDSPVCVPAVKALVTMGRFITVSQLNAVDMTERVVGQIIRQSESRPNHVTICLYLPLFHDATLPHINSPVILPQPVCHISCIDVIELMNISKFAVDIPIESITGLAFVFLATNVTEYLFHIQGMRGAYLIRYKFSFASNQLVELHSFTFFPFSDLYLEYNIRWYDCLGRSIFTSIEVVRQEMWRMLCNFGQSQGFFPKGTIKLPISNQFSYYMFNFLMQEGMHSQLLSIHDQERRVQSSLTYRSMKTSEMYHYIVFNDETTLQSLKNLLGNVAFVGIRRQKPKSESEEYLRLNDAVNITSKVEL